MHLAVGVVIVLPFIAFAPAHALAAWTHPNRRAARMGYVLAGLAVVVLVTGVGLMRVAGLDLRDPGLRALVYWAHVLAPIGVAWAFANHRRRGRALAGRGGLDVGDGHGGAGRPDRRHRRAHQPVAGGHRRRGELRAVAVANRHRPGDPGVGADGRRLLRRVPHRCPSRLAVERPPLQLVQQQGLRRQREGDAPGDAGPRRQRRRQPLVRRLPRSGAALQRRLRPRRLRHRERSHLAGRAHLHGLPRHRAGEQPPRQRRLHHRRAAPLPVRVLGIAGAARVEQAADQGQAGLPPHDLPQADAPHRGVLLDLPQGAHPRGAQRLQGVPARAEPLRQLHPERRVGTRRPQLLLSAEGRGALCRLPHAARHVARLRRAALRRQRRPPDPRSPLHRRQHRRGAPAQRSRHRAGASGVPRQGGDARHLRPARGRHGVGASHRTARRRRARSAAGPALPGGDRLAHAQGRPPFHPGHGRFQRGVGGADGAGRQPRDRAKRCPRARRPRRSVVALHQRLHARPAGPEGGPAQRPGHLRAALRQADSAGRRSGGALRAGPPRRRRRPDHDRGAAALPQVRPDDDEAGDGRRLSHRPAGDHDRVRGPGAAAAGRHAGAGAAGLGALERLRHRPAARGQRRQRQGRAAPGRSGVHRGGAARPARRAPQPGAGVPQGGPARGRRGRARSSEGRGRRALDRGLAHRPGQQGERPPRRRHRQLRGGALGHLARAAGPRLRLQPRLRGAERARAGALRTGQAGAWHALAPTPARGCCDGPWTPSSARWPSTRRT